MNGIQKLQEYRNKSGRSLFESGHVGIDIENYVVQSESDPLVEYVVKVTVDYRGLKCDCKDFETRGKWLECKHCMAVRYYAEMPLLEVVAQ
jgi:hypothetical protein